MKDIEKYDREYWEAVSVGLNMAAMDDVLENGIPKGWAFDTHGGAGTKEGSAWEERGQHSSTGLSKSRHKVSREEESDLFRELKDQRDWGCFVRNGVSGRTKGSDGPGYTRPWGFGKPLEFYSKDNWKPAIKCTRAGRV